MRSTSKPTEPRDTRPQEADAAGWYCVTRTCSNPEHWEGSREAAASPSRPGWVLSHGYLRD